MTETIVFGGGCFWCMEAVFQLLKGVISVESGYSGGVKENPTYEEVCSGKTGHAEVIRVVFDPEQIEFQDLLSVFFTTHDPTTRNQQGSDVGEQYRSVIYFTEEFQKQKIVDFINKIKAEKVFKDPILTEVKPLKNFYIAEEYHINYYRNNPGVGYCQVVINPKLAKLRHSFEKLVKE